MDNLNKITIIIIRLQALAFILSGLLYWAVIAGTFVIASLSDVPSTVENYTSYLMISVGYLLVGVILYARSRSLADYFIRGVEID